jgi:hypothetical protein
MRYAVTTRCILRRSQKSLAGPGLPKGVFRASMIGETKHRAISPGAFSVADRC